MSKKIISLTLALIIALGTFSVPALAADAPSSWAEESVNKAIEAKLVPQSLQSKYTQATTRAEFCALAVALYENIKSTITGCTTFTDTKDVNVEKMASIGVVSGIGNNKFDPDAKLTREQAAVMLSRLAEAVGKPFEKKAATFADNGKVSSWALEGVGQVQAEGIMGGVGNNTFAPQDPYTREQSIITILRTYDAVKGSGTTEPPKTTEPPANGSSYIGTWRHIATFNTTGSYGASGYGIDQVYILNQDGTFVLYLGSVTWQIVASSRVFESAYETFTKGNYQVSGGIISFTNVQSTTIKTDANGDWKSIATKDRTNRMIQNIPTSGYSASSLESKEFTVIDAEIIGIGKNADGNFYEFVKNW